MQIAFEKQHTIGQKRGSYECQITRDHIKRHEDDLKSSNWSKSMKSNRMLIRIQMKDENERKTNCFQLS